MQFTTITDDLVFPEGPVAMRDGSVLVCNQGPATLDRIHPDGRREVVATTGGGPNGAAIGPDGAVYLCNNGGSFYAQRVDGQLLLRPAPDQYSGGSIQRVDLKTGKVDTLYAACDGQPLVAPNDLMFDASGGFWFTDYGRDGDGVLYKGALYHALPDGSKITCLRRDMLSPNGIGLSPDGRKLYWADTYTARLYSADITGPGQLGPASRPWSHGDVLHNVQGDEVIDSLAMEADGRICVARNFGGIRVVAPDGTWDDISVPDGMVTNICFGGDDMRDAFITAGQTGRLLKCRWPRPGLRLPFTA